jgi:hypothetical protein
MACRSRCSANSCTTHDHNGTLGRLDDVRLSALTRRLALGCRSDVDDAQAVKPVRSFVVIVLREYGHARG